MDLDENKVQVKKWIPPNEVLDMLKTNAIQCGASISALCYEFLVTKNIRKKRLTNAAKGHIISSTVENHMGY